jgi:1-acyl-sn-glycerol-3-phosphate acyltransferase
VRRTARATVGVMGYWVLKALLSPIFLLLWRVRVEGRENVPTSGPAILAPNHVAFLDSMFVALVVRRRVTFAAKAEYFRSWKTAWFFRLVGQIPMRREGGSASERSLDATREVLRRGGVLGIYPEGTRSPDGRLYRGHTGVARLAFANRPSLIPVGIRGTADVQHPGSNLPRLFKTIVIRFGAPLELGHVEDAETTDPLALRTLTDELMFEIRSLSGQEYVDRYSKKHGVVGAADVSSLARSGAEPAVTSFAVDSSSTSDEKTLSLPRR